MRYWEDFLCLYMGYWYLSHSCGQQRLRRCWHVERMEVDEGKARIQKVLPEGVQQSYNSDHVFFSFIFDKGREDPIITKSGASPAHQRNAIEHWRANGGLTLNAGLAAL